MPGWIRIRQTPCRHVALWLVSSLFVLFLALPATAVMSGYDGEAASSDDADYTAGLAAWRNEDWQAVVEHMTRVIQRKPWHDQAHNLLGFAYRQLGDYQHSLQHYQQALDLNPYHRGALAYLGATYLAMGCRTQAVQTLERLATACQRVPGSDPGQWQSACKEWRDLSAAIAAYRASNGVTCELD